MARRSRILVGIVPIALIALVAGCSGGGGAQPVAPGSASGVTYTPVTSADGDAVLYVPTPGPFSASVATVNAAALGSSNPNVVAGTFYSFAASESVPASSSAEFSITIKFSPTSLPVGVPPSRLAIARYDPNPAEAYEAYADIGGSLDESANTISAKVTDTGIYGIIIAVPYTGSFTGSYTGASHGAFSLTVSAAGEAAVTITPAGSAAVLDSGTVSYAGLVRFTSTASPSAPLSFTGSLYRTGSATTGFGTWTDNFGTSGTWTIP